MHLVKMDLMLMMIVLLKCKITSFLKSEHFSLSYLDAYQRGDCEAKVRLAHCYAHGKGCEKDMAIAIEIYESAVDQGVLEALPALAKCLREFPERRNEAQNAISKFLASLTDIKLDSETLLTLVDEL